jgi:threonine dehydrogenase-like Zn-dependent dehydrogenase
MWGHSPAALFGYSHLLGGFPGGQAEYMLVPYADAGPLKIPEGLSDEQVLFLSDIFPTGFMAADFCGLKGGTRSRCGGADRSDSSPSKAHSCSAPNVS